MKITVITVCLNSENTIERTIKSVIRQNLGAGKLEYIVVDGGSADRTSAILNQYERHIDKYVSEPDQGIFDAMNKGISMATGDIIAFLNSDDYYENGALHLVLEAFETDSYDCICCDNFVLNKDGEKVYFDASTKITDKLHIHMPYYHSSIFSRKEFFKAEGNFDIQYKMAADYDWFLRIVENGARVHYIHCPVFTFCYGGVSSVNKIECAKEARQVALRHLPTADAEKCREKIDARLCETVLSVVDKEQVYPKLIKLLGEDRPTVLWGAGGKGIQCSRWFRKMGLKIEAFVDRNRSLWGSVIEQIPVFDPEIVDQMECNLIITPEKYAGEIKRELSSRKKKCTFVFEWNVLCKVLAEYVVEDLLA